MRSAPVPPAEHGGAHWDTDAKLREDGKAAGLDVWAQVGKGYSEVYLRDGVLGNAQLWSLREAVRREYHDELSVALPGEPSHVTLPGIDEALDGARAQWDHGDAPYVPEILALIRAAEAMRVQLFGSHRNDTDPQPVFVMKAQDRWAFWAISYYRDLLANNGLDDQAAQVDLALAEMTGWRERHPDLVKAPDHQHVPGTAPAAREQAAGTRPYVRNEVLRPYRYAGGPWDGKTADRPRAFTGPDHCSPMGPVPGNGTWAAADAWTGERYAPDGTDGDTVLMTWRRATVAELAGAAERRQVRDEERAVDYALDEAAEQRARDEDEAESAADLAATRRDEVRWAGGMGADDDD